MRTERELLIDCLERLNRLSVPYMLVGSMASNYWGVPPAGKLKNLSRAECAVIWRFGGLKGEVNRSKRTEIISLRFEMTVFNRSRLYRFGFAPELFDSSGKSITFDPEDTSAVSVVSRW